jgi:hypothetical protein
MPTETELEDYNRYFDDCERAQRIPLTFEQWQKRNHNNKE